jgi:deoxyhypusine monooxygenase
MVRHEAAEAAGAIGGPSAHALLAAHAADPAPEVAQTCTLALARVEHCARARAAGGGQGGEGEKKGEEAPRYLSVDPAPPAPAATPTPALVAAVADAGAPLWGRYRALFALRDRGGPDAVAALVVALRAGRPGAGPGPLGEGEEAKKKKKKQGGAAGTTGAATPPSTPPPVSQTALFKHEVAYVLGQMQEAASVPALVACLEDVGEHAMVRHEAAEALGAVGGPAAAVALKAGLADRDPIVAQSCEVALDVLAHEASGAFEYAA